MQIRNLGFDGRLCLDSPARKKDLRKEVGLYPCHNQGGNQVDSRILSMFYTVYIVVCLCACVFFGVRMDTRHATIRIARKEVAEYEYASRPLICKPHKRTKKKPGSHKTRGGNRTNGTHLEIAPSHPTTPPPPNMIRRATLCVPSNINRCHCRRRRCRNSSSLCIHVLPPTNLPSTSIQTIRRID